MKRKKYVAYGYVELSIIVPFGGASVRVDLTGGQQSSANGLVPASFTTTNPTLQKAIEDSPRFRSGYITIERVEDIPETFIVQHEEEKEAKAYDEVTNTQAARAVLMEDYGATLAQLQNKDAVKAMAEELNVKFPNWK